MENDKETLEPQLPGEWKHRQSSVGGTDSLGSLSTEGDSVQKG